MASPHHQRAIGTATPSSIYTKYRDYQTSNATSQPAGFSGISRPLAIRPATSPPLPPAPSVSGFVQHAVAVALDDVAGWGVMLAEALRETGGVLSDDERAWADDVLGVRTPPGRSAA